MSAAAETLPSAEQRLVDHLRRNGKLDAESAERAWRVFEQSGVSLTKILLELGLVPERDLVAAFAEGLGIPVAEAGEYPIEPILPDEATERFLKESKTVLLAANDDTVTVASIDPLDKFVIDALALATNRRVIVKAGTSGDIEEALRRLYADAEGSALAAAAGGAAQDATGADLARLRESASEAPVIRFVNALISRGVEAGASDIHIEPLERRLRIRTRIDGVLKEEEPAAIELAPAIVSRLKIMSGLDIAERRLPQDGAVKLAVRGKEIDLRIATAPVTHGEAVAVRILDKSSVALDFDALGFEPALQAKLGALLDRPNGIFLVTGPTGSGKTTTLYAALQRLNTAERKILSVEDPVEYKIAGVNQVQVKPDIGLTFAHVLRSFLRHDPDVILVGEIRDPETARIAVQAALTGHLVLSTVHTNSAASALTRLLDMHVEDYLLTSTIVGILAQRLVRQLCPACKEPAQLGAEWAAEAAAIGAPAQAKVFRANGCASCHGTGYRGRTVVSELLVPDEQIRRLVVDRAAAAQIHAAALGSGMEGLRRNGLRKVLAGVTTAEEVARVAQEET
jgi:general secretion pathway protein E